MSDTFNLVLGQVVFISYTTVQSTFSRQFDEVGENEVQCRLVLMVVKYFLPMKRINTRFDLFNAARNEKGEW
jgi:hypothetical protein